MRSITAFAIALLTLLLCVSRDTFAQQRRAADNRDVVPIEFSLKRGGSTEINSIQRGEKVFLPMRKMFDFLRIKNDYNPATATLSGFLATPETTWSVRLSDGSARVGKRTERLAPDEFVELDGDFYFLPEFYQRVFGLPIEYRPRQVAAVMDVRRDLPFFLDDRLRRQEVRDVMRDFADPAVKFEREYPLIDGFRLDWSFTQNLSPNGRPRQSFNGRTGFYILGGDLVSRYNVQLAPEFNLRESRHLWRHVPRSEKIFRQILIGDYVTDGLLTREQYGIRITSIPPYSRIHFAPEVIEGYGYANRKSYLFAGSRMSGVADTTVDGAFRFEYPLRYGANLVDVRSYSIWGELDQDSYRFLVPTSLVPPGEIDYDISVGRLRERSEPWHGSFSTFWGATSRLTAGARVEFFDNPSLERKVVPSLFGVARFTPHIAGEILYAPNTLGRASLTAEFPWLFSFDASYQRYKDVPLFNPRSANYEFSLSGGYLMVFNGVRLGLSSGLTETGLDASRETLWRGSLDAYFAIVYPRFTHFVGWRKSFDNNAIMTTIRQSDASVRFRLPRNLYLGFGSQYDHLRDELVNIRVNAAIRAIEKLTLDFEFNRNFQFGSSTLRLEVRYYLPFARLTSTTTSSRGIVSHGQRISGSIGIKPQTGDIVYDYRSRTSFGAFFIRPFLDINNNGIRDAGEEELRTRAPRSMASEGEIGSASLRQYNGLGWGNLSVSAYRTFHFRLDQRSLENPLWRPRYETFAVTAEPGRYSVIDVPVIVGGLVRGTVVYKASVGDFEKETVGGVRVSIKQIVDGETAIREPYEAVAETFSTGDFEFVGVPPGSYLLSLDLSQISLSGYVSQEMQKRITIQGTRDGDFVEGIEFILTEPR